MPNLRSNASDNPSIKDPELYEKLVDEGIGRAEDWIMKGEGSTDS